ncbi:hypothetical protein EV178_004396 [Coemansia sp. RSA 1646]|nr:hypothetical protein EV178_004396 [Coemansia sp. RSA 1646]KAJ1769404.1 hypothetical protein LPJ74_004067 [Coemansia sp. RSA 1843]KAJ2087976.1 hypothetical protein IW138_004573 [Coemansia sp. RSA 986]KAJ2211256.1 hypothetical protein EV179_005620 [Coemansia sp. RSA 487]
MPSGDEEPPASIQGMDEAPQENEVMSEDERLSDAESMEGSDTSSIYKKEYKTERVQRLFKQLKDRVDPQIANMVGPAGLSEKDHEQLMHLIADYFVPGAEKRDKQEKEKDRLYAEHQEAVAESAELWKELETEREQVRQLKATLLRKEANIRKKEETLRKCIAKEEVAEEKLKKCIQEDSMGRSLEEAQKARSERKKALNQVSQTHWTHSLRVSTDRSYAGVASQQGKRSIPNTQKITILESRMFEMPLWM